MGLTIARLLTLEKRTTTAIFIEARKTGYTTELFNELLELYKLHFAEATGIINVIQLASEQWPNFNFRDSINLIKKKFPRDASVIIDNAFPPGIKETEEKIKSVKEFAKKMKNKPLKLKEALNYTEPEYITALRKGTEKGYNGKLFFSLLKSVYPYIRQEVILAIRKTMQIWPNFNYEDAEKQVNKLKYKDFDKKLSYASFLDNNDDVKQVLGIGIKKTEQNIKNIKSSSTKLENKPLKLKEDTHMNFEHLKLLIKKAILYKRKHLKEDIVKKEKNLPSPRSKKTELKKIYKKILTGTPYEENIPLFMQLIDKVSDNYVNYELGINLDNAMKMVEELISGQGDFTPEELKNIINITKGIGFPAIEHYAAGGKAMPKEQQVFGAHHMDQNVKELMGSLESRRNPKNKLPAPATEKQISTTTPDIVHREVVLVPTEELRAGLTSKFNSRIARIIGMPEVKDTEFWRIASQMKTGGMNTERLAKSMADVIINSKTYEEAKEKAQEKLHLDFSKEDNLFKNFFKEKARQSEGARVKKTNEGTIKDFINKEEKPDEESENEKVPSKKILVAWIKKHPNFEDEVLHTWVEKNGWNIHEVEDMIYELATKEVMKSKDTNEETIMKLREFLLKEMSLPNVVNLDQATNAITMAYNAAMKGPVNQDVVGGLNAAAQWLQQQPNLGSDANLIQLAKKAKVAQQKLSLSRAPLSPNQPQFTTQRTDSYGKNINQ